MLTRSLALPQPSVKYDTQEQAQMRRTLMSGVNDLNAATAAQMTTLQAKDVKRTTSAADPTTTELPNDGDLAFHIKTVGPVYYFAANVGGVIKKVALT